MEIPASRLTTVTAKDVVKGQVPSSVESPRPATQGNIPTAVENSAPLLSPSTQILDGRTPLSIAAAVQNSVASALLSLLEELDQAPTALLLADALVPLETLLDELSTTGETSVKRAPITTENQSSGLGKRKFEATTPIKSREDSADTVILTTSSRGTTTKAQSGVLLPPLINSTPGDYEVAPQTDLGPKQPARSVQRDGIVITPRNDPSSQLAERSRDAPAFAKAQTTGMQPVKDPGIQANPEAPVATTPARPSFPPSSLLPNPSSAELLRVRETLRTLLNSPRGGDTETVLKTLIKALPDELLIRLIRDGSPLPQDASAIRALATEERYSALPKEVGAPTSIALRAPPRDAGTTSGAPKQAHSPQLVSTPSLTQGPVLPLPGALAQDVHQVSVAQSGRELPRAHDAHTSHLANQTAHSTSSATKSLLAIATHPALLSAMNTASLKKTYSSLSVRRKKASAGERHDPDRINGTTSNHENSSEREKESTGLAWLRVYLEQKEKNTKRASCD